MTSVASAPRRTALLAVAVLWMGLYPKPFTDVMDASVNELIRHVGQGKL